MLHLPTLTGAMLSTIARAVQSCFVLGSVGAEDSFGLKGNRTLRIEWAKSFSSLHSRKQVQIKPGRELYTDVQFAALVVNHYLVCMTLSMPDHHRRCLASLHRALGSHLGA